MIIHNREADADIVELLEGSAKGRSAQQPPGVLHCFSSTDPSYLERMLAAGYSVSLAGPLTYKSAADLRAMAVRVPRDRLLVETDCPYLTPASQRGRRNEPAFLAETAGCLADLLQLPRHELDAQLWANTRAHVSALGGGMSTTADISSQSEAIRAILALVRPGLDRVEASLSAWPTRTITFSGRCCRRCCQAAANACGRPWRC